MHVSTLRTLRARISARVLRPALVLTGILGLSLLVAQFGAAPTAHANSSFLRYNQGYYLTNWSGHTWLCYGWSSGEYHCTVHWHRNAAGTLVSDHTAWVPNSLGSAQTRAPAQSGRAASSHASSSGGGVASGGGSYSGDVQGLIRAVFGGYAGQALAIAACESGYNPGAVNPSSDASGVFQFLPSTWATTSYAGYSPFNAWANVNAAHQVFVRDGYSWREWQCQP
ncbi:MAG: transglycosylase family protein [Ktedonobacterales bacterium]